MRQLVSHYARPCLPCHLLVPPWRRGNLVRGCFIVHYCSSDPSFHLQLPPPKITQGFSPRFKLKSEEKWKSSSTSPLCRLCLSSQRRQCLSGRSESAVCRSVRWVGARGHLKLLNTVKLLSLTAAYFAVVCLLLTALDPSQLKGSGMDSQAVLSDQCVHCATRTASHNPDVHVGFGLD